MIFLIKAFLKHEKAFVDKNKGWHKITSFTWNIRKGSPEYLMHDENTFQDGVNINIF